MSQSVVYWYSGGTLKAVVVRVEFLCIVAVDTRLVDPSTVRVHPILMRWLRIVVRIPYCCRR